jgi:phosphocarrier protein
MYSETITIQNKTGLHARPAATFVQAASKFKSNITIETESKKGNAKSMLSLLSIGAAKGTSVKIGAEGEDEEQAVKALVALIQSKFGED